ncbi:MAG TPA: hypothetical protein VFV19_08815 [Candidatus Polarisedimenticolaceae bacterium]|nr:hypothetical protein [Candidatus Polarisedimenticolaceae bacterium]
MRATRRVAGIALAILACCAVAGLALAEDAPYLEYRYMKSAGQIQITTGFMERNSELPARAATLEKQGLYVLEANTLRTITKIEHAGTHEITTTIVVYPPAGHGEGGASSFVDLKVVMDGAILVDAPLCRASEGIDRIAIDPARRFVTLDAHDGLLRFDGFESKNTVDEDWLTARAKEMRVLVARGL